MNLRNLRIGPSTLPDIEIVLQDMAEAQRVDRSIMGVLGVNALSGADFTISPGAGRLAFGTERPAGEVVPFYRIEGRIALRVRMGEATLTMILDSGASHVALFRLPKAMAKTPPVSSNFATMEGARKIVPTCWKADMFFIDPLRVGTLPAAIVQRSGTTVDGLLPAGVFKTIHVDQARQELVLAR